MVGYYIVIPYYVHKINNKILTYERIIVAKYVNHGTKKEPFLGRALKRALKTVRFKVVL